MRVQFQTGSVSMNADHFPELKRLHAAAGFALMLVVFTPAWADEPVGGDLTIEASGFQDPSGHAVAKLFLPSDDVLKKGRWETSAAIQEGRAVLSFAAVPPGDYAVVVFHDANDNHEIDHTIIGLPKEALGFSGGFRMSLISGLPSFEKLRFTHGTAAQIISLTVR